MQYDLFHISQTFVMRKRIFTVNLASLVLVLVFVIFINRVFAIPATPANDVLTSKLTDTLKSITSNVSTSIQNDVDKVISSTMDILIDSSLSQLSNATILENRDSLSTIKYAPELGVNEQSFPVFGATN